MDISRLISPPSPESGQSVKLPALSHYSLASAATAPAALPTLSNTILSHGQSLDLTKPAAAQSPIAASQLSPIQLSRDPQPSSSVERPEPPQLPQSSGSRSRPEAPTPPQTSNSLKRPEPSHPLQASKPSKRPRLNPRQVSRPTSSRHSTPSSEQGQYAPLMPRSAYGSTARPLHSLAPRPLRAPNPAPPIFEHERIELDKICRPSVKGEVLLPFKCSRTGAIAHPRSFTEKSAESKLDFGGKRRSGRKPTEASILRSKAAAEKRARELRPTRLRIDQPVKAQLNIDIWAQIFQWTSPSTLFEIRHVTPFFEYILSLDKTWEASRISTFGHDMPGPPDGMTEATYCEYLTGTTCHSCNECPVRKVFWAFRKRWCNECYRTLTVREREARASLDNLHPLILNTIMSATRDSWGHYIGAGSIRHSAGLGDGRVACYLKSDIEQLRRDWQELLSGETFEMTPEQVTERRDKWIAERTAARDVLIEQARKIEDWQRNEDAKKKESYTDKREQRIAFFKRHAEAVGISEKALLSSMAYQRAAKIPKMPSERAWDILLPKIKEDLAALARKASRRASARHSEERALAAAAAAHRIPTLPPPIGNLNFARPSAAIHALPPHGIDAYLWQRQRQA
ncbi:hypothetical protein EJ05DRAFT_484433 [Pseudovirgaria hyperparasitica]|uniref:F-box domain-containing protein n=1 Tax=Pseudovirgaria hyperparasitica TaxID=470096 RepID=A0A6A6W9E9_9PEZI|nr:uncharacterized protein EJ05DRAFT_484433 [Pseudovirgaria hyperparasitica]KAF2759482.1 hypothetical protein EJ05DRAFT_484433 [Pseudovirgaria hyperparasitica]